MKRALRITSYSGLARYMATISEQEIGFIPRHSEIPSPYAYSPTQPVYYDDKRGNVVIIETAHRQYDVFLVEETIFRNESEAEAIYMESRKANGHGHDIQNGVCVLCDAGDPTSVINLREPCSGR